MADVNANIGVNIDTSAALSQLKSLQRQISQFHSSIAKSSETAALAQRDLQRNFLNSVNALGTFSAELRNVKTTSESFTNSLEKNKFSMREYFRYAGASTRTFGKLFKSEYDTIGRVAEDRVKKLQTQYIKMGRDATGAMKAIAIIPNELDMSNFSTQTQLAAQKQALFNQLMKQGSTNLLNFGKNTQWAGRQLMVGFTLPLMAVGSAASKTFMDMETQALKFRKVYGDLFTPQAETEDALKNIQALGREFTKYGIAVSSTVGLAAEAAAAGFQGVDLQRQTTEATRLSVLGQIDVQQALETTIALQNAFKTSSAELADQINFLNAVENQTVTSLDDITTAIPKVAPVIQQLGGDVKDLAFFITAMKEGGINASEGANALKSGLASLINPTSRARDMLQGLGIDIVNIVNKNRGDLKATVIGFAQALDTLAPLERARAIEQMFGKFQFARLSALFSNVTRDGTQAARVLDLAGASVQDLANLSESELGKTADSAMMKFRKSVEDLKVAIVPVGEAFLKAVTPIIEMVSKIAEKFADLSDRTKKAITILVTVVGGLGPVLLMTFGLLANGVANIIKLFLTLRNGYQRLTGNSQYLGEQTQYLTSEQIEAAAAAHSLNQAHATLTQQFTVENTELQKLIATYQAATNAAARFAATNPGMMIPPRGGKKAKGFANGGIIKGPGTGKSDSIPIMASNGEAIISADTVSNNEQAINNLIKTGKFVQKTDITGAPGNAARSSFSYSGVNRLLRGEGLPGATVGVPGNMSSVAAKAGTQSLNPFVSGHVAGFEPTALPSTIRNLEAVMGSLATSANKQDVALRELIDSTLKSSIGIQDFGRVVDGVAQAEASVVQISELQNKNAAMVSGGVGARITGNARNEAFRQARISEPITYRQAQEGMQLAMPIATSGNLSSGKKMLPQYFAEIQNFVQTTELINTEQEKAAFGFANMRKTIADQIVASNKNISQEQLSLEVDTRMTSLQNDLVKTGAAEFDAKTGLIKSMNDYKAELVFATEQLKTASSKNLGAATTSIPGINQATRVAMRSKPKDINVALNRKDTRAKLVMAGKRTDAALKTALQGTIPGLQGAGVNMGDAITEGIAQGAQTQSPSKKTIKVGEDIARGLEIGMQSRQDDINRIGNSLGQEATQSVTRGARRSSRAQGAPNALPMSQLSTQLASTPRTAEQVNKFSQAIKNANPRLEKMNSAIQTGSFALMSFSGVAQMFGGRLGAISNIIFNLSGALFALQTITQLVTKAKALELIATRANAAARLSGALNFKTLFVGLTTFGSKLLRVGKFVLNFLGPWGKLTAGVIAAVGVLAGLKKKQDEAKQKIEGLGDAALLTDKKLRTVADFFGRKPQTTRLERTGPQLILNQETRNRVDELRGSEGFKKEFGKDINTLKGATDKQAQLILQSLSIQLKGKGFAKDEIDIILKSLQEESGKTNLKLDFAGIDLATKEGQANFEKSINTLGKSLGNQFGKGYSSETVTAVSRTTGEVVTWTEEKLSKGLKKSLGLTSKAFAGMINGLSGQLENGSINAQQFNQSFEKISSTISSMPKPQAMLLMDNIIKNLPGPLAKAATGIKNVKDQMLIAQAAALGVATITPAMIQALKTASTSSDARAGSAAMRVRKQIKEDMKAIQEVMAIVNGQPAPGTVTGGQEAKDNSKVLSAAAKLNIARLQKELDLLKTKRDKVNETNDALKRQYEYQQKLMDLQKSSVEAKIRGDYIGAAMFGQAKAFETKEFNRETESIALDKKITDLSNRISALQANARLTKAEQAYAKSKTVKKAMGGLIKGPGTGRSDSILAGFSYGGLPQLAVSNGEYIVQSSAVQKYGVGFMDAINSKNVGVTNNSSGSTVYNVNMTVNGGNANANDIADQVIRKINLVAQRNNKSNVVGR